jgi:predicted porin
MNRRTCTHASSFRPALTAVAAALALVIPTPRALAADPEIEALKQMVKELKQELTALKEAQAKQAAEFATAPAAAPATGKVPAAAAAAAPGTFGVPGLKLYGILDSGVEHISNVGADKKSVTRVPSTTGTLPSRLGFDFEHPVGSELKGIAKAEMGIYLDSGSSGQASRLFGRQIYVGLDSPYGSLTVGRQYSMLFWGMLDSDILGPNIFGLGSIDAYLPNDRHDNTLVWKGKFSNVTLGATYSFGRDTLSTVPGSGTCSGEVAGSSQCKAWSAMAKYDDAAFGAAVAAVRQYGGTGATAFFFNGTPPIPFTSANDEDTRVTVNGYVKFAGLKVGVGWLNRKVETSTTKVEQDTTWLQAAYPFGQFVLDGGIVHVNNKDQHADANMYVLRGVYNFDAWLAAYLNLGYIDNNSKAAYGLSGGGAGTAPVAGVDQTGVMTGVRYRF